MHPHPSRLTAALLALGLLAGACSPGAFSLHHGDATRISISDDGDSSIQVRRPGYSLTMQCEGKATFLADESDLATLSAGGTFELSEPLDAALAVRALASGLDSDYELGQVLKDAAARGADLALAAIYLDAVGEIGSDYERRGALERIASAVAADPDLNRRYRDLARSLGDYERGQALKALDDAMAR